MIPDFSIKASRPTNVSRGLALKWHLTIVSFCLTDHLLVIQTPSFHRLDDGAHGISQFTERIFNPWRHFRENRPGNHAVFFKGSEVVSQYLLTDPGDRTQHLIESPGTGKEIAKDQQKCSN